ncbi:MAG TPA: LPS export ABC transporter ATP-binding protein [Spirochaetaceae bacterium]|nr:LPS export ABC transporter ATP-binding protein [Spirochaetaceae bacterium]
MSDPHSDQPAAPEALESRVNVDAAPLVTSDAAPPASADAVPDAIEAPATGDVITVAVDAPYDNVPPTVLDPRIQHVLEIRQLVKRFGRKIAVKGVSFSMQTGQVTGLLGPNGAGKTTSFYMIVGFIRPNSGGVYLDHHLLTAMPMYRRARLGIAYLPQEASVFRKLTVEQNILAILETRDDLNRRQQRQTADELLEEFGISSIRRQYAYTLSGGERRRTEIARALAIKPKFLLLDEPFAGIDPIAVHEIKSIVLRLSEKGIGVLITDHNVRDTLEITHRAHIIHQGQILVSGSRQDILNSELAREIYLGSNFTM